MDHQTLNATVQIEMNMVVDWYIIFEMISPTVDVLTKNV